MYFWISLAVVGLILALWLYCRRGARVPKHINYSPSLMADADTPPRSNEARPKVVQRFESFYDYCIQHGCWSAAVPKRAGESDEEYIVRFVRHRLSQIGEDVYHGCRGDTPLSPDECRRVADDAVGIYRKKAIDAGIDVD